MNVLAVIRYTAWAAVLALALVAGLVVMGVKPGGMSGDLPLAASIGGPFSLTSHEGRRFTDKDLAGRPFALFFGFANCPDICPTTLLELTNRLAELGPAAKDLQVVFVTVDPEQDTPAFLKTYLSNFDPRIVGLTGTPAEIADIARKYRADYKKVPTSTGYTMNHEASVYLMDRAGRWVGTLNYQEPADVQRKKLEMLLARR